MFLALAMTAAQLSALIFIGILIIAGVIVMGRTPNDVLDPRHEHNLDDNQPPIYHSGKADTFYKGVVVIFFIGLVGIAVTVFLH